MEGVWGSVEGERWGGGGIVENTKCFRYGL